MYADLRDAVSADPARARANFMVAVKLALAFVVLLALIQVVVSAPELDVARLGVRPREWAGLLGILTAPLVHADWAHLFGNAVPLVVLGTAMLHLYPRSSRVVLPAIYLGPGIAVWLFARGASHIGSSGLVYGMFAYVLVAGLLRRDRRALATSLLVCFLYGALVWGVLPIEVRMSWETHLAAALIGGALALLLRRRDIPLRKRYSWEDEEPVPEAVEPAEATPLDAPGSRTLH